MRKIFVISIVIGVIVLLGLIISVSFFRTSDKTAQNETSAFPTPVQSFSRSDSLFIEPTLTQNQASQLRTLERDLKTKSLTQRQVDTISSLKNAVSNSPVSNDAFEMVYSEDLNQFLILKKSNQADRALDEYFALNSVLNDLYQNDKFGYFSASTTPLAQALNQSITQIESYRNQKFDAEQANAQRQTRLISPTPNEEEQVKKAVKQVENLNSLFNLFTKPGRVRTAPATASGQTQINPTALPVKTSPSNLDALFNEAGQRVGVPPNILKGIMAHECGVLLSESVENIRAWSQPGAGLPITHKCFDGGKEKGDGKDLGPMQFYIPRYFAPYSQAVNTYGGYNRSNPNVENIVDAVYAAAQVVKEFSRHPQDANFSCLEVKRVSYCYACGCTDYDRGVLNSFSCRFAWTPGKGLFPYLWGYYTTGAAVQNGGC